MMKIHLTVGFMASFNENGLDRLNIILKSCLKNYFETKETIPTFLENCQWVVSEEFILFFFFVVQ